MNAELTAENRPAWLPSEISTEGIYRNQIAYEDERRVEILVVLPCVVSVKFVGLFAVDGEEVGAGIIGSQWLEEFFEGGVEANSYSWGQQRSGSHDNRMGGLYNFGSSWTITGSCC